MSKWLFRFGWMAVGVGALYAVSALAGVVSGGPLDPLGPPGSTMQTIDSIAPSWFRTLAADDGVDPCFSSRFVCVMNDEAVLDRETGLVWERSPSAIPNGVWYSALDECQQLRATGDRVGWRLPALPELMSLLVAPGFASLAERHPFLATLPSRYWTATTDADITGNAFAVLVQAVTSSQSYAKDGTHGQTIRAWCVRGPGGYEGL